MTHIDLDDVHVSLGDLHVLRGVDASVGEGNLVGLLGPNGAGKTTLLRTIAGILDPTSGSVHLGGTDVHSLGSRELSRRLATVPQETAISFDFTVRDVVAMGRHPHRPRFGADEDGPEAVEHALERTELVDLADRPITEVSGGERKRVLVARALAQDARTLLLDEPTAGLDVNHQIRTLDLVRDLVDEGRTALAAIHDLDLAARYCDELLVLSEGHVLAAGPPEAVLSESTVSEAFDARNAVAPNPVTGTPTVTPLSDPETAADPRRVHLLGGRGEGVAALASLVDAGHEVSVGPVPEGSRGARGRPPRLRDPGSAAIRSPR
ncbi:ATP-binding cassette domain-containing protein [Halospeciosus flavus]|uniref:ATP-binding cassette domain-containing protein n=1 Tax=Halospeciosus flavus TaxID=3032283 RepID=UPI0036103ECC